MNTILVTGGCGFIGSNFILRWAERYPDCRIVNVDFMTYAGDLSNLWSLRNDSRYVFVEDDVNHNTLIRKVLMQYQPKYIFHFAAETHVDRSISSAGVFVKTNVLGTVNLLDSVKFYLDRTQRSDVKFIHVSTDEVYGSLEDPTSQFDENSNFAPNSPYSASKAASDHFVRAYYKTHQLPVITVHSSNNYGPRQHREKLIPKIIAQAVAQQPVPIYGTGENRRDWLWVGDHCAALELIADRGIVGETYCVGGGEELTNNQVAEMILAHLNQSADLIAYVKDRPGHDLRYSVNSQKLQALGWAPTVNFAAGLPKTIDWYLQHLNKLQ